MLVSAGDRIEKGQPVARLYGERNVEVAGQRAREALELSEEPVEPSPAILGSL
jgi:thymidine phosphorylase